MQLRSSHIHLLIIIALNILIYANTFTNPFVWDDYDFIVGREAITSLENIPSFFVESTLGNLWRPLRETWYSITYSIWELSPFGYHLSALALHILICLLLYGITKEITTSKIALITALLFATHPVHTERVANMTASFDLLGLVFYCAALYLFILFRKQSDHKKCWLAVGMYALALLASEEAITLIGILLLYDWCFNNQLTKSKWKQAIKVYAPFVIITLVYLGVRTMVVGQIARSQSFLGETISTALLSTIASLKHYFLLLLFPLELSIYRSAPEVTTFFDGGVLVSALILLILLIGLVFAYKKSKRVFFAGAWFFITMFLFYNIIPKPTLVADRYLYLPSFGFCLLLALFIVWLAKHPLLQKKRMASWILVGIILLAYSVIAIERNTHWSDRELILQKAIEVDPLSSQAHWALGAYYRERGSVDEAFVHLTQAVELSSKNFAAYNELGVLLAEQGRFREAIPYLQSSIGTFPSSEGEYYKGYNDLGLVYAHLQEYDKAIDELQKAISIHPEFAKAHHDLAIVYARIGEIEKAIQEFEIAISINPDEEIYQQNYQNFKNAISS